MKLQLDGREVEAQEGSTLLDLCRAEGVDLPAPCHDGRLAPASTCRLCLVEVEGREHPVCACATPAEGGLVVRTASPPLLDYRRSMLGLLTERTLRPGWRDDRHPCLRVDLGACIDCFRCVRVCREVAGRDVWQIVGRGGRTTVGVLGKDLLDSGCVSCGACADACPSGAITHRAEARAERWTRTVCPYCGTGCELAVGTAEGRIASITAPPDAPVNRGHLCAKGRYAHGFVEAPDRVLHPMLRRGGRWVRTSWEEALDEAAGLLRRSHGANALLASARSTNEECFLAQKFARLAMGTGSVDCCARVCHAPSAAALGQLFGTGAATNAFADLELAQALLVVGANPTENHPIVGDRLRQRARAGVPLVVIDPRRTELAAEATLHLALRPGTNLPLLQAMAQLIIEEGLADTAFLEARTKGFEAYAAHVRPWTPDAAARICEVEAADIARAARLYASHRPAWSCHGLGLAEHRQGTEGVLALAHLALLTGNLGVPGGGVNPLRGQNNVQGAAQMGCQPGHLTGHQPYAAARAAHEARWGCRLPKPGLDALETVDAALEGKLKALLLIGYDLLHSHPQQARTAEALARLDGLIVVDLFLHESASASGTIFLPAASSFEKEGTFMNGERRVQRVRAALPPRGEARSELWILAELAARLGHRGAFAYSGAEAVWDEVRALWPAVAGMSYARLETGGLQWPCPSLDHPGTAVLHAGAFPIGAKAAFHLLEWTPTPESAQADHPLLLMTGRDLHHFNAETMTSRSAAQALQPRGSLDLHPADAAARGIQSGDLVEVESRHGRIFLPARLDDRVGQGRAFCAFHGPEAHVNRLVGPGRDGATHTPEYKVVAVEARKPGSGA